MQGYFQGTEDAKKNALRNLANRLCCTLVTTKKNYRGEAEIIDVPAASSSEYQFDSRSEVFLLGRLLEHTHRLRIGQLNWQMAHRPKGPLQFFVPTGYVAGQRG
jgi:hypothetical protein